MFICNDIYDVIVIGGGHAGCEAALAAAKLGAKTLLLTQNLDTIAQMSCNPSIGGIAKGQIVREIDALGGAMGRITDFSALHYHMLNTGKGPAVHSPRVQCDKKVYQFAFKHLLEKQPNLDIMQDEAVRVSTSDNHVDGVLTLRDTFYKTKTVILTTGTFLGGTIHIGTVMTRGGRYNDMPADALSKNLSRELGLHLLRFKTGTPMRINARGLDYSKFRLQPSDNPLQPISHFTDALQQQKRKFLSCYITRTTLATDKILRENFQRSAMYGGNIHSMGPRYCPSVEDKIKKFPEVTSHPLFLEPEGAHTEEYYIQGFSTSMPEDVQRALIASVPGMEHASITRMGYAVEYDCSDPLDLFPHLESKIIPGLFCAGQINGTTGYEEAGGQGLMAG
ncbi:MAG: tRNA uridine-5-carboxymethylaminomethyl(34) synthesis enzyme MnmG, partial [Elusimicrobiaceae bacterium]|nr:tRNA uridine-5-carboxymethylaminomethyl(34) synthesis enzyme MnmG [Elusimicrobiaceae bacterium]